MQGWGYVLCGSQWANTWQKLFAFDAVSYMLQAIAGQILLIFPIVYGFTNHAPFNSVRLQFGFYFFPFILTAILPSTIALGWLKTSSEKVRVCMCACACVACVATCHS